MLLRIVGLWNDAKNARVNPTFTSETVVATPGVATTVSDVKQESTFFSSKFAICIVELCYAAIPSEGTERIVY